MWAEVCHATDGGRSIIAWEKKPRYAVNPYLCAVVPLDPASYEAMVSKVSKYLGGIRFDPDNYGDADGLARAVLRIVLGAPAKA